ncbi:hypothetical protein HOLleu_01772 [Holothuria leucospilota]|uniref:Uncharacterized protein n=1 Tax=Holothuria leucospilota TaxID=206669 RepID=A0A9Q1CNT9_HOLLE|nr:hypothetical protein HOLleu_01772 [Holothuria leucospilota]
MDFPEIRDQIVTLLIGCDVPEAFWVNEERRGRKKEPYAVKSLLGWTIMGPVGSSGGSVGSVNYVQIEDSMLEQQVARFWDTDFGDLSVNKRGESQEDNRAQHAMESSVELIDGHYKVRLPWRCWPVQPIIKYGIGIQVELLGLEGDPEVKKSAHVAPADSLPLKGLADFINFHSSWNKLRRGAAWLVRFKKYLHNKYKGKGSDGCERGPLTLLEIQEAERAILRLVQGTTFPEVVRQLQGSENVKGWKNPGLSQFRKLRPILFDGIIRVGGRLRRAPISDEVKHPTVLPNRHHVTNLVILHYHALVGHSGAGLSWASLKDSGFCKVGLLLDV